jgi:PAS domain S-box-containing protein
METEFEKGKFYEVILDSSIDGVVVVDRDFNVRYMNKTIEAWSGFKREEAIGRHCSEVAPDMNCDKICPPRSTFEDGASHTLENVISARDGSKIYQLVTSSPIYDKNGGLYACIEIISDITDRKLAEHKLKDTIELLEKWQQLTTNREEKMIELKEEIKELKKKLGERKQRY